VIVHSLPVPQRQVRVAMLLAVDLEMWGVLGVATSGSRSRHTSFCWPSWTSYRE